MADILIVTGSTSDMPVVEKAEAVLKEHGVSYAVEVASAHRDPERVAELARRGDVKVFIAIAGLSGTAGGACIPDHPPRHRGAGGGRPWRA